MRITIPPSGINLLSECPRCFWEEYIGMNMGVKRPKHIFPSITNGIDRVMKQVFDKYRATGATVAESIIPQPFRLYPDQERVNRLRQFDGGLWVHVTRGEDTFTLHGLLDDLLSYGSQVAVVDFKSTGEPVSSDTYEKAIKWYQGQMSLYAYMLQQDMFNVYGERAILVYVWPEMTMTGIPTLNTQHVAIPIDPNYGYQLFMQAVNVLSGPPPSPSPSCMYCKYRGIV